MLIFIDLDGTLTNTVHPAWRPYKDGLNKIAINQVPVFPGAKEFVVSRQNKGDIVVTLSDSHPRYVEPISRLFNIEAISLADKPNITKLNAFIDSRPQIKKQIDDRKCFVIGDTILDIEIGRHIAASTIWFLPYQITDEIKDNRDGIGDEMLCKKMGPTYVARTFEEMETIIDNPLQNLYSIESAFAGSSSLRSIKFFYNRYLDGSFACIRCLARQEQGICDRFGRADKYFQMSNSERAFDFLQSLAAAVTSYIGQQRIIKQGWDYFTYLTDKKTTIPRYKMKEIFGLVQTTIPKIELFTWEDNADGSLRNRNHYSERKDFLEKYLNVNCPTERGIGPFCEERDVELSLKNKNIMVLDDQLTTGATAWYVIRKLKSLGVRNILFIAMFQMVLVVHNDMVCPRCGKPMLIKLRRSDGHKFYSCMPPEYKGDGCGFIVDIPEY